MAAKFGRKYELVVGEHKINDVRMRFNCEYQSGGFVPLLEIELYNLNKHTVNEVLLRDTEFTFSAGYEGDFPIIFKGQVRNVFTFRDDVDLLTVILAGGSDQQLREKLIYTTLKDAKSLKEVIQDYLRIAKIPEGQIDIKESAIKNPISKADNFLNVMRSTAAEYNFNWFIYNNEFYAYGKNKHPNRGVYKISSETGLLEVPILTDQGIDVRTLMEPSVRPQDRYEVDSEGLAVNQVATSFVAIRDNVRGQQTAFEVRHLGDTHSNQWYTELRGLANVNR